MLLFRVFVTLAFLITALSFIHGCGLTLDVNVHVDGTVEHVVSSNVGELIPTLNTIL